MRNDSELVLLLVLVLSGLSWFVMKAAWIAASAAVRAVRGKEDEHPVDWHGQAPPACRACGYDLRGSPEHCPECGTKLDPLDAAIVRYMIRLGPTPIGQGDGRGRGEAPPPDGRWSLRIRPGRRGELKHPVGRSR